MCAERMVAVSGPGGKIQHALVSQEDFCTMNGVYWQIGTDGYARRRASKAERDNGSPVSIAMHRQVLGLHLVKGAPGSPEVDHINRNRLDNRRENLRVVNRTINSMNRAGTGKYSHVCGVSFFKPARLWRAYINLDRRRVELGYFKTEKEAIEARHAAAKTLYGDSVIIHRSETL